MEPVKRYLLIGAGGTGTSFLDPALRYLRAHHGGNSDPGVWQFGVLDGDSVEPHNLDRQIFRPETIKMNKAQAAVQPHVYMGNVIPIPEYLGRHNAAQYLSDGITIFIAVDNFPVRSIIESFCLTLENCVVINGGNELDTGSCQIWIRKDGENVTPPLSFLHPQIHEPGQDRAEMTCEEIAALPGGGQLIAANMASAMYMLSALISTHQVLKWTEAQWSIFGRSDTMDNRDLRGWRPEVEVVN